jgi:gamma-glutamylcyclotransferase (GGCT)/AIG2-like uncharacterized protein YtfP
VTRPLVPILPVAVYGTLRVGQPNAGLWRGRAWASTGWAVRGYRLVGAGRGFPYAIPADEDDMIVVDLLTLDGLDVLARLDRLEGVDHGHYDRVLAAAERRPRDGCYELATVWLYVPADHRTAALWAAEPVPGNDWVAHVARDLDDAPWR